MPQFPIQDIDDESVGRRKRMKTEATLCDDGTMHIKAYTRNKRRNRGFRGRVFVSLFQANHLIWATKDFQCTTRGGTWDPTTPSKGTDVFSVSVPKQIAQCTSHIEIEQDDRPTDNSEIGQLIDIIKCNLERFDALRQFKDQIGNCAGSIGT